MRIFWISAVAACFAFETFAEGPVTDPVAAEIFDLDRVSMARDLSCMQERMECSGFGAMLDANPPRSRAGVLASFQCIKEYLQCMRDSTTQTATDLENIRLPR